MTNKILEETKKIDKEFNTFITINEKFKGEKPIVVKDNICTRGIQTTAGSKILEGFTPPYDATVITKLKEKKFDVLGKNTQDAFGFGSFSTNCAYKIPKNPYDKERVCGGSSGGTAAFIKLSKHVDYGLGQSTGGSISCPSAFCGVVGLTPTYGLVSRYGLVDYASSFDRIGPITKTTRQSAELLTIIAGKDELDQTTQNKNEDYTKYVNKSVKGIKVCYIKEYFEKTDKKIVASLKKALKDLEKEGIKVTEISFPEVEQAIAAYYIIAMAEASTNLAKFCGMRYGQEGKVEEISYNNYFKKIRTSSFGEEEKRRILLGTFVRMAGYKDEFYKKALLVKETISEKFKELFKKFDAIITPTMLMLPPKFSEVKKLTAVENYRIDFPTVPPSLAGLPTISIPIEETNGLPVGMQIISDHFQEKNLIKIASAYEK